MYRKQIIILLLTFSILLYGDMVYNVTFNSQNIGVSQKTGYDVISIKGTEFMNEVGKPMLPVKYVHLIIPSNMEVSTVSAITSSPYDIPGNFYIYPAQPPIPADSNTQAFVPPDPNVYNSDSPYPDKKSVFIHSDYFDGANHIVTIGVYPVEYHPLSRTLTLYTDITLSLTFISSSHTSKKAEYRTPYAQKIYEKALKSVVDNPEDIKSYSYIPSITDSPPKTKSISFYPYVIITNSTLAPYFAPFVNWLTQKGIKAGIVTTDDIYASYSGDEISGIYDNPGKIRQYLSDSYEIGATSWALLGGDEDIVPLRYGTVLYGISDPNASQIPADIYFADFDGDWNVDGDQYYGEMDDDSPDFGSEIFVGRVPANTSDEVNNWIEKVLSYEKNPGNGDYSYLTRAFWDAADDMNGDPANLSAYYPSYFTSTIDSEPDRDGDWAGPTGQK